MTAFGSGGSINDDCQEREKWKENKGPANEGGHES